MKVIGIILILVSESSIADEYYYSFNPDFMNKRVIECDEYIRTNIESFVKDLESILFSYNDMNWMQTDKLVSKYIPENKSENILKHPFINQLSYCSANYSFSGPVNHYREFYINATLFLTYVGVNTEKKRILDYDLYGDFKKIRSSYEHLLSSVNITANKAFKRDRPENRPAP